MQIPKLGFSMTEGTIAEWLVTDGDQVSEGQVIYRVSTDKVETDVEAPATGIVRLIGAEEQTYPVGALVAEIEGEGGYRHRERSADLPVRQTDENGTSPEG